jgi:hypothetical protein
MAPLPGSEAHFVLERDGFALLVERDGEDIRGIGAAGLVTSEGLAVLYWRDGKACFMRRGFEQPATDQQVTAVRAFSADVEGALRP